ncbi:MAG: hypothetical protein O3A93_13475 [Chloroflexi bacterium]|nr:hypothetical protein [Chloroflexota bacterium]MDA1272243.1 hypothetical protein [Chloroflexota bacterium]
MASAKGHCAMIGCKRPVHQALAIAPGTVVELCAEHFSTEKKDLEMKKAA